jgi:hypothetical protein
MITKVLEAYNFTFNLTPTQATIMLRELHANAGFGAQVVLPPQLIFFFF